MAIATAHACCEMNTLLTALARGAAALVPLTLLALALAFVAAVAVVWPGEERRKMVGQLAEAMKSLGAVIAGSADRREEIASVGTSDGQPRRSAEVAAGHGGDRLDLAGDQADRAVQPLDPAGHDQRAGVERLAGGVVPTPRVGGSR